jgi:ferric-dicitrate binding protein FerR (iron transport regulator)
MGDAMKGLGREPTRQRDAADWVAENGADHEVEEATVASWEEWVTSPKNEVEYVALIDALERIRRLPAPEPVSREALIADARADRDSDS